MKATIENRLERLEQDDGAPWSEVERWIVNGERATNRDTGETMPAADLKASRSKEGRLLVIRTIVRPEGAIP